MVRLLQRAQLVRRLTEEHKARLAAGRKKRADSLRETGAARAVAFSTWSERHAIVWRDWQLNCGRAMHDCEYCAEYRRISSEIPELGRDEDFDYARAEGLI